MSYDDVSFSMDFVSLRNIEFDKYLKYQKGISKYFKIYDLDFLGKPISGVMGMFVYGNLVSGMNEIAKEFGIKENYFWGSGFLTKEYIVSKEGNCNTFLLVVWQLGIYSKKAESLHEANGMKIIFL